MGIQLYSVLFHNSILDSSNCSKGSQFSFLYIPNHYRISNALVCHQCSVSSAGNKFPLSSLARGAFLCKFATISVFHQDLTHVDTISSGFTDLTFDFLAEESSNNC